MVVDEIDHIEAQVLCFVEQQTRGTPADEVYVLEITSIRFEKFTPAIKAQLQKFSSMQMLTINDCGLNDLTNFPHLPSLIRLDLVFNKINGDSLLNLRGSRHLQTLMLGANNITNVNDLRGLGQMKEILQIDLLNNPVVTSEGYREAVFEIFPTLHILDTLDKKGIDPAKANLDISASRIPLSLFDRSDQATASSSSNFYGSTALRDKSAAAIARTSRIKPAVRLVDFQTNKQVTKPASSVSKMSIERAVAIVPAQRKAPVPRSSVVPRKSRSASSRSGLIFPCGRIRRFLKKTVREYRLSSSSPVYLAGVLEYLAAEILEQAGNFVKAEKVSRVTPRHIRNVFRTDEELGQFVKGSIIAEAGSTDTKSIDIQLLKGKSKQ